MSNSRIKNSILNVSTSIINQVLSLILNFIVRTVFIKVLGESYLGINGLFSNILSVLSLAELGIGSAIIYSMYKPLAEKDEEKLTALINYYKTLYNRIAMIVMAVGLSIVPLLKYLVNFEFKMDNQVLFYLLYLTNTVVSYLLAYKTSIVTADQKQYKLKPYYMCFSILTSLVQIFVISKFHNYVLYILVQISFSIITNIVCAKKSSEMYSFINNKGTSLSIEEKHSIWSNIKSMFCYQIGGVILNNTDNILISVLIGTVWVGYYSNYSMIVNAIVGFTSLIFTSIQGSIGNLNVDTNDSNKKYFIFNVLNLISFWVYGFCSVCFCVLFQDFIRIWLGEKYILNISIVFVIVFNYYITGVLYPIWCYRNTIGLFKHTKYIMLIASFLNLLLSILGAKLFGLFGIFLATGLSRIMTNVWFEPYKLYKIYFNKPVKKYYITQILYFILLSTIIFIMYLITSNIIIKNAYILICIKLILCIIIVNTIFYFFFRKTDEFVYIKNSIIKKLLKKY